MLNNKRGHNASKKGFIRTRKPVPKAPSVNSLKKTESFSQREARQSKKEKIVFHLFFSGVGGWFGMLAAGIGSVIAGVSDQAQTIMQFSAALIAAPITYFILGKF